VATLTPMHARELHFGVPELKPGFGLAIPAFQAFRTIENPILAL